MEQEVLGTVGSIHPVLSILPRPQGAPGGTGLRLSTSDVLAPLVTLGSSFIGSSSSVNPCSREEHRQSSPVSTRDGQSSLSTRQDSFIS